MKRAGDTYWLEDPYNWIPEEFDLKTDRKTWYRAVKYLLLDNQLYKKG